MSQLRNYLNQINDEIQFASFYMKTLNIIFRLQQQHFIQIKNSSAKMIKKTHKRLTHDQKVSKCEEFIKNYEDFDMMDDNPAYEQYGRRKYMIKLQQLANEELKIYEIFMQDLQSYFRKDQQKQLVQEFKSSTTRFNIIFEQLVDKLLPQRNINLTPDNQLKHKFENILHEQRRDNMKTDGPLAQNQSIPTKSYKTFDVSIVYGPGSKIRIDCISDFTSDKIGALVVCKAIVIRATQVKPQLVIGTFACDSCGCENYYEVNNQQFGPMVKCQSKTCIQNQINGKLSFLPGHSKFKCYQQLRIQQTPDQLKQGKIPRNFSIKVRGNLVKQANPGDVVMIQGILLPRKKDGYNADLAFTLHLVASKIVREKKKYIQMNLNQQKVDQILHIRGNYNEQEFFQKLAKSIAPEIYGLQYVKKSLLLLMTGGVTKVTADNLKIRGEINIALFGDPGIAKSQLLKHISYLAPRGVYTTGKGSSGVGLTAAVVRDPNTHELALEAGALVLADMGVCCIDQFDKMDEYDRTAIHEVMQQQTISIAKAGITTSLNARTSILAAANPAYGRYNSQYSPEKNINLPAALLSRFDLIFVLLDTKQYTKDAELARHIGSVHRLGKAPMADTEVFSPQFIRSYIAMSKQYEPILTEQLHNQIIQRYTRKRQQQLSASNDGESYTTMRSLLAIIRLAQARARLRFSNQISKADLNDALIMIEESQKSVIGKKSGRKQNIQPISAVYKICKQMCLYKADKRVEYDVLKRAALARGYSEDVLEDMLINYENLNVIMRVDNWITIVDQG